MLFILIYLRRLAGGGADGGGGGGADGSDDDPAALGQFDDDVFRLFAIGPLAPSLSALLVDEDPDACSHGTRGTGGGCGGNGCDSDDGPAPAGRLGGNVFRLFSLGPLASPLPALLVDDNPCPLDDEPGE